MTNRIQALMGAGVLTLGLGLASGPVPAAAAQAWTVTLSPAVTTVPTGSFVTLQATANADVGTSPYNIEIFDINSGGLVSQCYTGTYCNGVVMQPVNTTHEYQAFVAFPSSTYPPPPAVSGSSPSPAAASNIATVTWNGGGAGGGFSSSCDANSTLTVFDGFVETLYGKLRYSQNGLGGATVCFRLADPAPIVGGSLVISTAVAPALPSLDGNIQACANTPGNLIPGPHPLDQGTLGGVPHYFDWYAGTGAVFICFQAGGAPTRLIIPISAGTLPSVVPNLDTPPVGAPAAVPWPAGLNSSRCDVNKVVDANIGGTQLWLGTAQPSGTEVDVCVRTQGATNQGGFLAVNTNGTPGIFPVFNTQPNPSLCSGNPFIDQRAPVNLQVWIPTGNPAAICVGGLVNESIEIGVAGSLVIPSVTWNPDTGTV